MDITRHNYEEFFILYMDNELTPADRLRVESFVAVHPDLKEELDLLLQSRFEPDTAIEFSPKELLYKTSSADTVNESNYEEWLLLYTDNELTAGEKKLVEDFAATRPAVQQELALFQLTRFSPDSEVVFPAKESLYRTEEKERKVIYLTWRRIAIAASILLAIATTTFFLMKGETVENTSGIANETEQATPVITGDQPSKNVVKEELPSSNDETNAQDLISNDQKAPSSVDATAPVKNNQPEKKSDQGKEIMPDIAQPVNPAIAGNNVKKNANGLPQPTYNPNVKDITPEDNLTAIERPAIERLTNQKEIISGQLVTPQHNQALDYTETASLKTPVNIEPEDEAEPGRKNKLRGFFRKMTRTFEKTTNIKATDDEDRLLIGGVAIRL